MFGQQRRNGLFGPPPEPDSARACSNCAEHAATDQARNKKGPTMRHDATSSSSVPKPSGGRPRRRSVESDRTSDEGDDRGARSNVERVPPDDREGDEIGPQRGYDESR